MTDFIKQLNEKGYCIIKNVLSEDEIDFAKQKFYNWYNSIDNFDYINNNISSHNVLKFHEVGHQEFAWYLRTKPQIIDIFKKIHNTDELVVSFDGCCYYKPNNRLSKSNWTHTDQSPVNDLFCVQSFIALTDNVQNSLIVYENSHKLHHQYFIEQNLENYKQNYHKIDKDYLNRITNSKKLLNVPKGSLVLWNSKTFHQNIIQNSDEERIVQYICYLPKNHIKNTKTQKEKRLKYFNERRTTTHWSYPIRVNSKQGNTYGNQELKIDYDSLQKPNLEPYKETIMELI